MEPNIFHLYRSLTDEGYIFCFCGSITQSIVEGIGETLWQRMELEGAEMSTIGKVFPIFIEQMQNIVNYSAERIPPFSESTEEQRFGIVTVGKSGAKFSVCCGNYVENGKVEALRERLTGLKNLGKDRLKKLYKEELRKAKEEGKSKGAGLGFIDMARRVSEPLQFEIVPVDEEKSFFSMRTII
jgi:hypothetical protein